MTPVSAHRYKVLDSYCTERLWSSHTLLMDLFRLCVSTEWILSNGDQQLHINIRPAVMAVFVLLLSPLCAAASDQHVMTVHPGDDVTLPCEAGNVSILAVEWTRADLESPEYVLFYIDGDSDPTHQHPSFKGRVELVDRELKDGDVSLILKNVSSRDSGTYECRVAAGGSGRTKRAILKTDPISIIYLEVTDSKDENSMDGKYPRGRVGLAAGSGVVAVLLVAAAVFVV